MKTAVETVFVGKSRLLSTPMPSASSFVRTDASSPNILVCSAAARRFSIPGLGAGSGAQAGALRNGAPFKELGAAGASGAPGGEIESARAPQRRK
jgi:hypothetical protein